MAVGRRGVDIKDIIRELQVLNRNKYHRVWKYLMKLNKERSNEQVSGT